MRQKSILKYVGIALIAASFTGCMIPNAVNKEKRGDMPGTFSSSNDTMTSGAILRKNFFSDSNLLALIDTALANNQELNIILQEINVARNDIMAKKGEYLPFLHIGGAAGTDKSGRYTRYGALEANNEIKTGTPFPAAVPDYTFGAKLSWEVDIWKKLRNARQSTVYKYLGTIEGKNFMVTRLVSEIAYSYYELLALDNQLEILRQNIQIQQNALQIVRLQKLAGKVTELAVLRFEAEVMKNKSRQFYIEQRIIEAENRINFLVGRFPQPVIRESSKFLQMVPDSIHAGIPSQLLANRPDIRQAEYGLMSAKLDIKVARANFYPSLRITGGVGYQAFNPQYLISTPQSMIYNMAGELMAPLINRKAIKATFLNANAKQVQAVYSYEKAVLNGFVDVTNGMANISNLKQSYSFKEGQVQALTKSIQISTTLFKSARADYMEVLLTQRDALESKMELVEIKKQQLNAVVKMYQTLGGGWN
ncbi:MAG: efflux transporter outer membrane subunit [Bacteroidetes bacterium]|nr:efflux transporter outer membrane subunit [Bacteroidota bacterium]